MTSRLKLVRALVIAALWSDVLSRDAWRRAWNAVRALLGIGGEGAKVCRTIAQSRRLACLRCPAYEPKWETCGSPLSGQPELGCWCYVGEGGKSELASASCWGDDNLGPDFEYGWQKNVVK